MIYESESQNCKIPYLIRGKTEFALLFSYHVEKRALQFFLALGFIFCDVKIVIFTLTIEFIKLWNINSKYIKFLWNSRFSTILNFFEVNWLDIVTSLILYKNFLIKYTHMYLINHAFEKSKMYDILYNIILN